MGDEVTTENKTEGSAEPRPTVPAFPLPAPNDRRSLKKLSVFALVLGIVSIVVVAAVLVSLWHKVSTDDAQVDAHITTVSTRVPGYVNGVVVNDNQYVKAGDLLLRIDPRDYQAGPSPGCLSCRVGNRAFGESACPADAQRDVNKRRRLAGSKISFGSRPAEVKRLCRRGRNRGTRSRPGERCRQTRCQRARTG